MPEAFLVIGLQPMIALPNHERLADVA